MSDNSILRRTRSNFNAKRLNDRDTAELIGICRGVLADGVLVEEEVIFILQWLESKPHLLEQWPTDDLYDDLAKAMEDGVLDSDEEKLLLDVISKLTGMAQQEDDSDASTALPLSSPMPDIVFEGNGFCLTGTFSSNNRKQCEQIIEERGGFFRKDPSKNIQYLVIGSKNTSAWTQSSFGRKIQKAVDLQRKGHDIAVVTEEHWLEFI